IGCTPNYSLRGGKSPSPRSSFGISMRLHEFTVRPRGFFDGPGRREATAAIRHHGSDGAVIVPRALAPATRFHSGVSRPAQMTRPVAPWCATDAPNQDTHNGRRGLLLC